VFNPSLIAIWFDSVATLRGSHVQTRVSLPDLSAGPSRMMQMAITGIGD
jgi:hypothetical protein